MIPQTPMKGSIVVDGKASSDGFCKQILDQLGRRRFSEEDQFAVHLALEEAFNNAVEHGNRGDPAKTVQIDYTVDDRRIEIRMTDQGNGFEPRKVADPRLDENIFQATGRGLLLMRAYMDTVEYNSQGNSVRMVRSRRDPLQGAP